MKLLENVPTLTSLDRKALGLNQLEHDAFKALCDIADDLQDIYLVTAHSNYVIIKSADDHVLLALYERLHNQAWLIQQKHEPATTKN